MQIIKYFNLLIVNRNHYHWLYCFFLLVKNMYYSRIKKIQNLDETLRIIYVENSVFVKYNIF